MAVTRMLCGRMPAAVPSARANWRVRFSALGTNKWYGMLSTTSSVVSE